MIINFISSFSGGRSWRTVATSQFNHRLTRGAIYSVSICGFLNNHINKIKCCKYKWKHTLVAKSKKPLRQISERVREQSTVQRETEKLRRGVKEVLTHCWFRATVGEGPAVSHCTIVHAGGYLCHLFFHIARAANIEQSENGNNMSPKGAAFSCTYIFYMNHFQVIIRSFTLKQIFYQNNVNSIFLLEQKRGISNRHTFLGV